MKGNAPTLTPPFPLEADSNVSESPLLIEKTDTLCPAKGKKLPPTIFIIFGAIGDLTKRKLIPALYNLVSNQHLPEEFAVIGVDCVPMSTEEEIFMNYPRAKLNRPFVIGSSSACTIFLGILKTHTRMKHSKDVSIK